MYEMEEASPGLAAPAQPVTRPTRRDVPPAGATHPQKPPVSRLPLRPLSCLRGGARFQR